MTFHKTGTITSPAYLESLFLSRRRWPRASAAADETVATVVTIGAVITPDSAEETPGPLLLAFSSRLADDFAREIVSAKRIQIDLDVSGIGRSSRERNNTNV